VTSYSTSAPLTGARSIAPPSSGRLARPVTPEGAPSRVATRRRTGRLAARGRNRRRESGPARMCERTIRSLEAAMRVPKTQFARAPGDVNIAYQVFGEGQADVVWLWGLASSIEV